MGLEGKQMFASYDRMLWILTVFFFFLSFFKWLEMSTLLPELFPFPQPLGTY